ncbi:MAG: hypothetical protein IPM99_17565 [Rubrivivax sp.]|nr:hypothetical protein [Rubrivivax sp.]
MTHFRFDNAVSSLAQYGYGLFTIGQGRGLLQFGGIGPQTELYYHMEWELQASATDGGARMDYDLEFLVPTPRCVAAACRCRRCRAAARAR